jgi:hypothetical protein
MESAPSSSNANDEVFETKWLVISMEINVAKKKGMNQCSTLLANNLHFIIALITW